MPLPFGDLLSGFVERIASETIGFGIGEALARGLEPESTMLAQESWQATPERALDADVAAGIVAQRLTDASWGEGEAAQSGINAERFARLVEDELRAPDTGTLLTLWRRGLIDDATFLHGLRKAKIEEEWADPLRALRVVPLSPQEVAVAVQRGLLAAGDLLPVAPPTGTGDVPPMPTVGIDPYAAAAAHGAGPDELRVLTRIVGLPPAPGELLQLLNRGEIQEVDYYRGIAEGNTRNEWAPFLEKLRRHLLTPHEYVEARVRGWVDDAAMYAGTALHGVTRDDTDLLFKVTGRPLSFHQVWIGLQRGGTYDGPTTEIDPAFLKQLEESNIRPEWYSLAWAQRYSLPSAFVVRSLLKDGSITPEEARTIFVQSGWPPDLAAKVAGTATGGPAASADPHVKKAQTTLYTSTHRAFVAGQADESAARHVLTTLGVPAAEQGHVIDLWTQERGVRHRTLTTYQIKQAYEEKHFTEAQALERLAALGLSTLDAQAFLAS